VAIDWEGMTMLLTAVWTQNRDDWQRARMRGVATGIGEDYRHNASD